MMTEPQAHYEIYEPPAPPEFEEPRTSLTVPHSREAEEAVIGSVLINPEMYFEILRVIPAAQYFHIHRNGWVWEGFGRLVEKKMPIDLLTVSEELERTNQLADVGGSSYLTSLINQVPSSLNAVSYAYIVREHYDRRRGIELANKVASAAFSGKPFNLAAQAEHFLKDAARVGNRVTAKEAAGEMIDLLDNVRYCTTSLPDLDKRLGGLFPSELSIWAGYSGTGKSAFKQQIARKNADQGKRVLLCDLEMTAAQTWFRMACGDLGFDMNDVRSGRISPEARTRIVEYAAQLGEHYEDKIVIYEAPMSPADILSAVMMEQPDLVFVDTLKNLSGKDAKSNIRDWYDYALNFLRLNVALSKDAGRPHVGVLHHLSRDAKKTSRKPTKEDLMFAGEADADGVHILYAPDEDKSKEKPVLPLLCITEKSRFGWTGETEIMFNKPRQAFFDKTRRSDG